MYASSESTGETGSPEHLLLADLINTKISRAGSNDVCLKIKTILSKLWTTLKFQNLCGKGCYGMFVLKLYDEAIYLHVDLF